MKKNALPNDSQLVVYPIGEKPHPFLASDFVDLPPLH
jgi:hypothetical protein